MTTAPLTDRLVVHSRPVPDPGPLLELPPSPHGVLSWVRGGDGLVGWGRAAVIRTAGRDRFADAQRRWSNFADRLDVRDEVGVAGSGPVAFVSLAFGPEPGTSVLVVPRTVVGRRDGVSWVTEIDTGDVAAERVVPVRPPRGVRYSDGQLPVTGWHEAVTAAVDRMRADPNLLAKVVLAHDLLAVATDDIDPRFLLRGLGARYPSCWAFAVDGLVGATPELLLRRRGDTVSSRVLAGTTWPHAGVEPSALAAELLGSAKDRDEHRYAVESLATSLSPHCRRLDVPTEPSILTLRNVIHLATDLVGTLTDDTALLDLAAAVHPTAAVGGTPTPDAVHAIGEFETMDRGRYAGPVGWVDARGDGELGIALRCAELDGPVARLFAGCGIVPSSDPDTEVTEAAAKLVAMRDALEGLR